MRRFDDRTRHFNFEFEKPDHRRRTRMLPPSSLVPLLLALQSRSSNCIHRPYHLGGWDNRLRLARVALFFSSSETIAETVSYLRLAAGSGTTLADQMRPASRLAIPMFAVPFTQSEEWNEFRCRADGSVVWSSRSLEQGDTVFAIQAFTHRRSRGDHSPSIPSL